MERKRHEGDDEEEAGRREDGGKVVVTEKVGGQIIKSVRLLATSSNLKELINATSQVCSSANQLSNQCLAMPMLSAERQERDRMSERKTQRGEKKRGGGTDRRLEWANVIVVHFTNPDKGWWGETDQFAILWTAALATKAGHESKHIK